MCFMIFLPRDARLATLSRIAASQHGLVTHAQAVGAGCGEELLRGLLRKGGVQRVHRGVFRFLAVPRSFEQRVLAACLACDGVACRHTAVRLHGFEPDGLRPAPRPDVLSRRTTHHPGAGGFVVHTTRRLGEDDLVSLRGIPVTSPARTLRDVAGLLPAAVLDGFIGHLLATRAIGPSELLRLVAPRPPRPGGRVLRLAVERAGVTTAPDSSLEHRALVLVRAAGLPEAVAQFPVHAGGHPVAVLDFAWPDQRVALEVDGYRWHAAPGAFAGDRRRDNLLRELGWSVYRTTASEIEAGAPHLLRQLGRALSARTGGRAQKPAIRRPSASNRSPRSRSLAVPGHGGA